MQATERGSAVMSSRSSSLVRACAIAVAALAGWHSLTINSRAEGIEYPNPYRMIENPLTLPKGREMGWISGLAIDKNGRDLWVADSCGGDLNACVTTNVDAVMHFDANGKFV